MESKISLASRVLANLYLSCAYDCVICIIQTVGRITTNRTKQSVFMKAEIQACVHLSENYIKSDSTINCISNSIHANLTKAKLWLNCVKLFKLYSLFFHAVRQRKVIKNSYALKLIIRKNVLNNFKNCLLRMKKKKKIEHNSLGM